MDTSNDGTTTSATDIVTHQMSLLRWPPATTTLSPPPQAPRAASARRARDLRFDVHAAQLVAQLVGPREVARAPRTDPAVEQLLGGGVERACSHMQHRVQPHAAQDATGWSVGGVFRDRAVWDWGLTAAESAR